MNRTLDIESLQQDLVSIIRFLKVFSLKPIHSMQIEPNWDYQRSVVFLLLISFFSSIISAIIQSSYLGLIFVVVVPFAFLAAAVIMTFVLSYLIQFVHDRQIETEKLFQVVCISLAPFLFFRIFRTIAPPVTIIGVAATCALLVVGMSDRFHLPRKSIMKIISVFFASYLLFWALDLVRRSNYSRINTQSISEDTIRLLDQEIKGD